VTEPSGTLWIVATPIGTIKDLGARARDVLAAVDVIVAEDTRRARALLAHAGIRAGRRLRSLHEHNESRRVPEILAALEGGRSAALISDAGTPVLSDPGYLLVRSARERRIEVASVPGPSAFTAALAAAGQPPLPAALVGFLPAKPGARRRRIRELAQWRHSLVVLLSPHRLSDELEDLACGLGGERPATLMAELSKVHERALMGSLAELAESGEALAPRGEYVLVVGPVPAATSPASDPPSRAVVRAVYQRAVEQGSSRREAIRVAMEELDLTRRQVYALLVDSERNS
jgi:16S rRNA (cytidine1402-2'-O)-methyltransferase